MNKFIFKFDDNTEFLAEDFIDGHLINPLLLAGLVPHSPFIIRAEHQFSVHTLINGCLRCSGVFNNLRDAINCAKNKPTWH
jgi:hypothetical protein